MKGKLSEESVEFEIANDKEEGGWVSTIANEITAAVNTKLEHKLAELVEYYTKRLEEAPEIKKLIENYVHHGWNQLARDAELMTNITDDDRLELSLSFGIEHAAGHYIVDFDLAELLEQEFAIWEDSVLPALQKIRETIDKIILEKAKHASD